MKTHTTKWLLILFLGFINFGQGYAQHLLGASAVWDDDIREWEVYVQVDSFLLEGELELTYPLGNRYDKWTVRIGDYYANIDQTFSNDDTKWELTDGAATITIRQVWPRDRSEWKISDGNQSIVIKTKYRNTADEWLSLDRSGGELYIATEYVGDFRDWIVEDYMDESTSFSMRMAALFISIYNSIPK